MAPFYEEICQGVRVRKAFECAPALVGVNVVRPVGRSTLTPPARRRAMAPVPGPAVFLCQVELQGVEGVLGAGLAIDPPDYEQLGRFAFTETGGVVGPRLPVLSARIGRESFPLLGQPLLDGGVGVAARVDIAQDTVAVGMRGGTRRVDGGRDTGCEQVEEVVAEGGVEADVLGLPVQPHILDLPVVSGHAVWT